MDVLTAMETCTAMRYFKEDPVSKKDLEKLIYAATRASSPGNSQGWEFLVIDDPQIKSVVGDKMLAGMAPFFANRPPGQDGVEERMLVGAEHLARNFAKVPAWVVCMARKVYPPHDPQDAFMHSTIYPAAQNMIVAARSMGIGTCFTTFPGHAEPEIRQLCNVPDQLHMFVYIAVGYPEREFMPVKRKPIEEVVTWNRY
ncbi:MAG: nitroreductase family protein [Pseudomonadota bacterium]